MSSAPQNPQTQLPGIGARALGETVAPEALIEPATGRDGAPARQDPAHKTPAPHLEAETQFVAASHTDHSPPPSTAPPRPTHAQIGQIAAYLENRYQEVDRREQRLHIQLALLDQDRRTFQIETEDAAALAATRTADLTAVQDELDRRSEAALRLERELQDLREALLRERHNLSLEREQFIESCAEQRRAFDEDCRRERQEITHLREDAEADAARIREELRQEHVLLDNRHRFQQEHLRRTMREFEQQQVEFRREQQVSQTRLTETEAQLVLRNRQLNRIRELLIERQHSVERERQWLLVERRAIESRIQEDRDELRRERSEWENERNSQKADLRRQNDMLALHADNLEARRQRLDRLRVELEETNRQTLEMRLAVEESYAQLTQTVGTEATRASVDQAREILIEQYRHSREALFMQRQELEQLQARLHQQRQDILDERKLLVEWVEQQEQQFAARAEGSRREKESLDAREQSWRESAEKWAREKLQAESVIRDLLRQLDEGERGA
ncbi:MAG: hypothetical protein EHM42_03945 [Planctomycetaceae bacterium]|nr:MAG: hypothetical protein EHM42_03945 [Planctomycetaceae bacterium]